MGMITLIGVAILLDGNGYAYMVAILLSGMNTLTEVAILLTGNGYTYRGGNFAKAE